MPAVGAQRLKSIELADVERYMAAKRRTGASPATINRHLNLLNEIFAGAARRKLVRINPVQLVERLREPRRRWTILSPTEIARVARAFDELIGEAATATERAWLEQARVVFLVVVGAGLRRGEILGLRWRDVDLADPDGPVLRVRETWVCNGIDTPKSEAGERTIALDPVLAE